MTQDMTETLLSERDINSKIAQGGSLGALREKTASTHTLPILIEYAWSMARVWLEYGWSMARSWLEYGWSMARSWLEPIFEGSHVAKSALRPIVVLFTLLMTVGVGEAWADDLPGVYYIKSGVNNSDTEVSSASALYYLCPANNNTQNLYNEFGKPFLTTHTAEEDMSNFVWRIVKKDGEDSYYVIHDKDGKYLTINDDVLVGTRIAPKEREIMDEAVNHGFPVITLHDNGFADRYHPSADRLDLCAADRLLIVSPWQYQYRGKNEQITVLFCKAMNCVAQALCRTRDDWWK